MNRCRGDIWLTITSLKDELTQWHHTRGSRFLFVCLFACFVVVVVVVVVVIVVVVKHGSRIRHWFLHFTFTICYFFIKKILKMGIEFHIIVIKVNMTTVNNWYSNICTCKVKLFCFFLFQVVCLKSNDVTGNYCKQVTEKDQCEHSDWNCLGATSNTRQSHSKVRRKNNLTHCNLYLYFMTPGICHNWGTRLLILSIDCLSETVR